MNFKEMFEACKAAMQALREAWGHELTQEQKDVLDGLFAVVADLRRQWMDEGFMTCHQCGLPVLPHSGYLREHLDAGCEAGQSLSLDPENLIQAITQAREKAALETLHKLAGSPEVIKKAERNLLDGNRADWREISDSTRLRRAIIDCALSDLLSERRESRGGYAPITRQDMRDFARLIHHVIEAKWERDPDGDLPIEVVIVNRNTHYRMYYQRVPYAHEEDADLMLIFRRLRTNVSIAWGDLDSFIRTYVDAGGLEVPKLIADALRRQNQEEVDDVEE